MSHQFEKAAVAFGPLPVQARERLLQEIEEINWIALSDTNFLPPTAAHNEARFRTIASTARKLLILMNHEDSETTPADEFINLEVSLNPVVFAYDSVVQTRRLASGFDLSVQIIPLQRFVVALADLSNGAAEAASTQKKLKRKSRGGNIKGGTTSIKTTLMRYSFSLYDKTRREYPESGPQIANGPPLVRFVSGVLDGAGFPQKSNNRASTPNKDVVTGAFKKWDGDGRPSLHEMREKKFRIRS